MRAEVIAVSNTAALLREASESELLARCRTGDLEAFAQLVQRYRERIFNLAWQLLGNRDDAEDVAQETFLHAFEHLSEFRGDAQLLTWLYRIAINACKMKVRQRKFVEPLPEDFEPAEEIDWGAIEERWLLKRKIDAVLAKLSEPLRLVLVLREMHELSYDEIASVLGIPVGTVRSRLFEARRKFAQIWREMFGDEIR
ncbi:MAG: sigma-70 family RNA polymerase sigma factor [Candidatus Fervidibacter sacchari]